MKRCFHLFTNASEREEQRFIFHHPFVMIFVGFFVLPILMVGMIALCVACVLGFLHFFLGVF